MDNPPMDPFETPRDFHDIRAEAPAAIKADSRHRLKASLGTVKTAMSFAGLAMSAANDVRARNGSNTLSKSDAFQTQTAVVAMQPNGRRHAEVKLEELQLPPVMERIPYDTIEVLVNHENVWANLQGHSIASCSFNLEEKERWLPFIEPLGLSWKDVGSEPPKTGKGKELVNEKLATALAASTGGLVEFSVREFSQFGTDMKDGLTRDDFIKCGSTYFMPQGGFEPRPFYSVGRIGPKLPTQRLGALRSQIYQAVKGAFASWRGTRNLRTRWHANLEPILEEGLAIYEMAACSSHATDHRAVDKWRGSLLTMLPVDHRYVGRAFTFSVTSPELIVDYLMSRHDYHEQGHKDVSFLLAVRCFSHYGAVASIWVYIGYLIPQLTSKRSEKKGKGDED